MRLIYLLLFFLLSFPTMAAPLEKIICFDQVSSSLAQLKLIGPWIRHHEKGFIWLQNKSQDFTVHIFQLDFEAIILVEKKDTLTSQVFDEKKKCSKSVSIMPNDKNQFSTLTFFEMAKKAPKFVILQWSPHMNISLEQLRVLKNEKFDVPVFFSMDPLANLEEGMKVVERDKLEVQILQKWNHVGLLPSTIEHYPNLLFIKDGKILKYIPGFHNAKTIRKLIQENL